MINYIYKSFLLTTIENITNRKGVGKLKLLILSIAMLAILVKVIIHEKTKNDSHIVLIVSILADIVTVCGYFYFTR